MLNNVISRALSAIAILLGSGAAQAHPGSHMEMTTPGLMHHLLSSPFHGLLVLGALVIVAAIVWKVNHQKSSE